MLRLHGGAAVQRPDLMMTGTGVSLIIVSAGMRPDPCGSTANALTPDGPSGRRTEQDSIMRLIHAWSAPLGVDGLSDRV